MRLVDIGANLAHDSFDHDRPALLQRAWDAGLDAIVITGSCAASSARALTLAQDDPQRLFSTAGLHPHHASAWSVEMLAQFRDLAQHPQVVSLGECGLDYFRDLSPRADQQRAFVAQLQLAAELKKPLFLHQRDAHADFLPILREHRPQLGHVVVHCFTDTREAMEAYVALDCHIGITGWVCDERRGKTLFEAVKHIPDERLLIETDAPYLLPRTAMQKEVRVPRSGDKQERPQKADSRRNEPCFLPYVVQTLAQARAQAEAHVARITTDNARRFFGI